MSTRVLLLTSTLGSGHLRAAQAVEAALMTAIIITQSSSTMPTAVITLSST